MSSRSLERIGPVNGWIDRAILGVVVLGSACIPLAVLPHAFDAYRLPKDVALRAEAILILTVVLGALVLGATPQRLPRDRWLLLPSLAFGWMIVVTLTSTNPTVSVWRLAAGAATLIVFMATLHVARRQGALLVGVPIAVAIANAVLAMMQELNLWMPFGTQPGLAHHLQCTGFIGNPNELGSYLAVALLACFAAAAADEGRRSRFTIAAAVLAVGLVASQTLTAIIAFLAGGLVMLAMHSWRRALVIAASGAVLAVLLVALVSPLRKRATNVVHWVREGEYNAILTERLTAFEAASSMLADHPITGIGPGAFGWNYYTYKGRAELRYPTLRRAYNRGVNFGEVHNDHLQVLAEGGIPGYIVFLTIVGTVGTISLGGREAPETPLRRFSVLLALPLATLWLVLSIAQFPLETTAVRMLVVHLAALCAGWRTS